MAFSLSSPNHHSNQQPISLVKNSPRKRLPSSSPLLASINDAFQAKCAKELNKLRSNCRKTLQQDLTRLLDKETLADTFIEGDTFRKSCHSCLLASRVPLFYSHLVNYFDYTVTKHSRKGFNSYRLPSTIDCKEITDFLSKVYCHEDISLEETLIIDKLRDHITINMTSESGIDKKSISSSGGDELNPIGINNNDLVRDDSLDDIKESGKGDIDKDSLKPSDSLELVTDSLNNISLSSEDNNKNDHQSTDYEDSLATRTKEREDGGLTSSGSSQMVRSGTFDRLSSIPLEDSSRKDIPEEKLVYNNDADQMFKLIEEKPMLVNNLRHKIDSFELNLNCIPKDCSSTKDSLENEEAIVNDVDVITPLAEAAESLTTRSQSSSLFQFFVDMDSMSASLPNCQPSTKEEKTNNMTSSGFMFIDLNSVGTDGGSEQKSRTIERDKNKTKVNSKKDEGERSSKNDSILSMKLSTSRSTRCRSSQSDDNNNNQQSLEKSNQQIGSHLISGKSMNYHRQASCSSGLRGGPSTTDRNFLQIKNRNKNFNRQSSSPMSSMDSGMLSSLNSENPHGDEEDWLLSIKTNRTRTNKPSSSLWISTGEGQPESEQYDDTSCNKLNSIGSKQKHQLITSANSSTFSDNNNNENSSVDNNDNNEMYKRTINACSKLGEDLLQMYMNNINSDITIKVDNSSSIKAHKCILIARSPYFAAMFSGEWRDSKTSTITLQGFSYTSVHFALCHIYSGALNIPDDDNLNLAELALLSNLLALDTLRDVVIYELEKTYCHFFHKPCNDCIVGIVDCLIVSSECGFSTLHQKCLTWSGKHFGRLWPTRSFACLPSSILNSCFQSTIHSMTPKSIIDVILNVDRLAKTTPKVKWAEPIFSLIGRLIEQCVNFVAGSYDLIVASDSFISLGRGNSWNISALEETFLAAMNNLTPDTACKTLVKLNNIISIAENEKAFGYGPYAEPYVSLVRKMYRHCERSLVQNVNQAVIAPNWSLLPLEVQQKIKDSAIIVFEFDKPLAPRPQLSSSQLQSLRAKKRSSMITEQSSTSSVTKSSTSSANYKTGGTHRSRLRSGGESRSQASLKRSSSDHIYDEVTLESGDLIDGAASLPVTTIKNDHRSRHDNHRNRSSSGRHSRDGLSSSTSNDNNNDLVDSLNSSINDERYLETENPRKMINKQSNVNRHTKSPQSTPSRQSNHRPSSSRPRTSSVSRSLASRPPFK
ncbi:uncharacterized protein LOC128387364 [Panonychus citri]|uniref:uncharacterized protein LOC128387364 n=1 Tax=Panonychus citri TaxID=50023 RepID=UPI002307619F|nr:uncharacterized protein LOC128387364 [Panonychus citri]